MQVLEDPIGSTALHVRPQCIVALTPRDEVELCPDVIEQLEALDDVMFVAIDGDPEALDAAASTWYRVLSDLGWETVEESRQQYLRRAQSVLNTLREQPNHSPEEAFAAIEIVSLLDDRFSGKTGGLRGAISVRK